MIFDLLMRNRALMTDTAVTCYSRCGSLDGPVKADYSTHSNSWVYYITVVSGQDAVYGLFWFVRVRHWSRAHTTNVYQLLLETDQCVGVIQRIPVHEFLFTFNVRN